MVDEMTNKSERGVAASGGCGAGRRAGAMPFRRYPKTVAIEGFVRSWPEKVFERAPRWCSVDLRDGNQALVEPMGWDRKIRLFETIVDAGFSEIEVGFPSASATEFDFVRRLIEDGFVPEGVTIQVLTQCRPNLIDRTFEAIRGAESAIVHFYNSTSPLQRDVVFGADRAAIRDIAVGAAKQIRALADVHEGGELRSEYSPESFSGTEIDFAVEVCEAVVDVIAPTHEVPMILNLPATVEMATPNVYADQVEAFGQAISCRDVVTLSAHPHNDRGCAVAAGELACLAGADRVEGTLFGNGERTGNVDIVTMALNLMSQGIDPELDFRDLPRIVRSVEHANRLPVHPRHPYAGELVFTAFSGSHQDAIRKGLSAVQKRTDESWEVPYLPIDPADVGGTYEAVIRINSQSGKGGIAYVLESEFGYVLPRRMQIEFARIVQEDADKSGEEIDAQQIHRLFARTYLACGAEGDDGPRLVGRRSVTSGADGRTDVVRAEVQWRDRRIALHGVGAGPVDAFVHAFSNAAGQEFKVGDYHEHAIGSGADASAAAYVELIFDDGRRLYGVGDAPSIVDATFTAVLNAAVRGDLGD